MEFNLEKDIVFFDLEATGLNVIRDRVVQIALVKYKPNGESEEMESLINPEIPISEEAISVHGITPDMIKDKPTFKDQAQKLFDFIGDADLAGYNSNRFDIPMLMEEFARTGLDLDMSVRRTVDVQRIFYKMEPRTLSAALQFYCGRKIENAHDALADVRATVDVLKGQLDRYEHTDIEDDNGGIVRQPVKNDIESLYQFTNDFRMLDATQRLKYNERGEVVFNFGKYQGKSVLETIVKDRNYYNWILDKDFSHQVKQTIRKMMSTYLQDQNDKLNQNKQ